MASTAPCTENGDVPGGSTVYSQFWVPTCVGPNAYRWQLAETDQCLSGIVNFPLGEYGGIMVSTADCSDNGFVGTGINLANQAWTLTDATP
jgi:hypothetical protein